MVTPGAKRNIFPPQLAALVNHGPLVGKVFRLGVADVICRYLIQPFIAPFKTYAIGRTNLGGRLHSSPGIVFEAEEVQPLPNERIEIRIAGDADRYRRAQ